ncbi:MAG TPA: hypothetical protein DGR97_03060, partial [Gammaproteobacteria bacterium]|nr:hypothetical protein [Gammaproteobacteria bacterium]
SAAWDALQEIDQSAVIFAHFMLINAIVTRAIKDERLVCFEPDYVSMTHLQLTPDACRLVAMGNAINPL